MVFEKIRKIISARTGLDKNDISLNSNIVDDLELDSIEIFEIVSEIEDEFSIEIDEDSYESFKTLKDVVEYIENAIE